MPRSADISVFSCLDLILVCKTISSGLKAEKNLLAENKGGLWTFPSVEFALFCENKRLGKQGIFPVEIGIRD
jgi:hypothetical protein